MFNKNIFFKKNGVFASPIKSDLGYPFAFLYSERMIISFLFIGISLADNPKPKQISFQDPATPAMLGIIDLHHEVMFWITFIVFFVFQLLIIEIYYFSYTTENSLSIKFIKKRFKFTSCSILETIWTIFPIYILWSIASPSLALLYSIEEEKNPDLTVKINGRQWYWNYEITDFMEFMSKFKPINIVFDSYYSRVENLTGHIRLLDVDNAIYFPIRTEIRLIITSDDVIHSWTIPSFGIKLDAIPGRLNTSTIFISRRGVFYGQCSELCGVGHGFMPITAVVTSRIGFFDWVLKASEIRKYTLYAHIILSGGDLPMIKNGVDFISEIVSVPASVIQTSSADSENKTSENSDSSVNNADNNDDFDEEDPCKSYGVCEIERDENGRIIPKSKKTIIEAIRTFLPMYASDDPDHRRALNAIINDKFNFEFWGHWSYKGHIAKEWPDKKDRVKAIALFFCDWLELRHMKIYKEVHAEYFKRLNECAVNGGCENDVLLKTFVEYKKKFPRPYRCVRDEKGKCKMLPVDIENDVNSQIIEETTSKTDTK